MWVMGRSVPPRSLYYGPTGPTDEIVSFQTIMVALPDGKILYSNNSNQLYVYGPSDTLLAARQTRHHRHQNQSRRQLPLDRHRI